MLSPSAPTSHTIAFAVPSVVVTIGPALLPLYCAHQAKVIGVLPLAATLSKVRLLPEQCELPELVKATIVPVPVS